MDIYSRFKALPRARKGTTTVVIVEEAALAELIADAQASEFNLASQFRSRAMGGSVAIGGRSGGVPMQINIDPPAPPGVAIAAAQLDEVLATARARRGRGPR